MEQLEPLSDNAATHAKAFADTWQSLRLKPFWLKICRKFKRVIFVVLHLNTCSMADGSWCPAPVGKRSQMGACVQSQVWVQVKVLHGEKHTWTTEAFFWSQFSSVSRCDATVWETAKCALTASQQAETEAK